MKKIVTSLVVMAFIITAAIAQPTIKDQADKKKHGKKHHKKSMAFEQLNLTEDQKAQIKANRADFQKQMKALSSNENQTVKQLRDQRAALAKAQKAKMENILTTDQKSKLADMKTKAVAKHEERSVQHLDKMKQELNLSDNQVAAIRKNQETTKSKLIALKENDQIDRAAKREQLKALKNEMKQNMANVLTKEQQQKLESHKGDMKHKMMKPKDKMMERKEAK